MALAMVPARTAPIVMMGSIRKPLIASKHRKNEAERRAYEIGRQGVNRRSGDSLALRPKVGRRLVAEELQPFHQRNGIRSLVVEPQLLAQDHPNSLDERQLVELRQRHLDVSAAVAASDAQHHAR